MQSQLWVISLIIPAKYSGFGEILSNDKSITGDLTVDTSDMNGQTITVELNDVPIANFTGGTPYTYPGLEEGDKVELVVGNGIEIPLFSDGFEGEDNGGGGGDGWDLIVESITLSDSLLGTNQHYGVTATFRNIGNQPSPANNAPNRVDINIYLSEDDVLEDLTDLRETDNIETSILPNETLTQCANVQGYGAGRVGDFSTFVCIVTASGETDDTNNCLSVPTTISTAEPSNDVFCD